MVYVPLPSLTLTFINKAALPFSGIDILYGRWASGLVNPNPDGSPPSAAAIRAISDQSAYIGVGITFGMWATTGGFFLTSSVQSDQCRSPRPAWSPGCDERTSLPSSPRTRPVR
jgi:hypothetical protein